MMKISLVTMGQGNPIALRRTIEAFLPVVDEIIFGDVLLFEEDRKVIETYKHEYPLRTFQFDFNYIFKNGFSAILNELASYAKNRYVIYMNVSEVIDGGDFKAALSDEYNAYYFDHAMEKHHWFRFYDKTEMRWRGIIHEEIHPIPGRKVELRACPTPSFRMADTDKDMDSPFKAKVYNDVKELVYFFNYMKLVDCPELIGVTHPGWVDYARDGYQSLKERIEKKGARYQAFIDSNLEAYLEDAYANKEFQEEELIVDRFPRKDQ